MRITTRNAIVGSCLGLTLAVGGYFYLTRSPVLDTKEKVKYLEKFVRENGTKLNAKNSQVFSLGSGLKGEYNGETGTYFISVMDREGKAGWPYNEQINPLLRISLENKRTPPLVNMADHNIDGGVDIFEKREKGKEVLDWNRRIHGNRTDLQKEYSEVVDSLYDRFR